MTVDWIAFWGVTTWGLAAVSACVTLAAFITWVDPSSKAVGVLATGWPTLAAALLTVLLVALAVAVGG